VGDATSTTKKVASGARDGGGDVNDDIRYLVLCRVAVGKVFVTSKEYRGFPSVGTDPAFDSMYNPLQEEYLVLRPHQVLPEFVIQYVLKKNPAAQATTVTSSTTASTTATSASSTTNSSAQQNQTEIPLIPIDLSTPHVILPEQDVAWRISIASMPESKSIKKTNDGTTALVAPTPLVTPRTRLPTAWSSSSDERGKKNSNTSTDLPSGVSPVVRAAEIVRREQLTSWEQLRLNAARQRETILERTQSLHNTYRQLNAKLRVRCLTYFFLKEFW
jgi:hypothetical protein